MGTMKTTCLDTCSKPLRVDFRIAHPSIAIQKIENAVGLQSSVKQQAGEARKTPKGIVLDGKYETTYCVFDGPLASDFEEIVEWCNRLIDKHQIFLEELLETGGDLEIRIACFPDAYIGFELDRLFLIKLLEYKIQIGFEVYGIKDKNTNVLSG